MNLKELKLIKNKYYVKKYLVTVTDIKTVRSTMFSGRKQSDLNPKAREAFAKSSIDIGVGIFKALMLVIFILPVTLIAKAVFDGSSEVISVSDIFDSISSGVWFLFWFLVIVAILASAYYRDNGIKILHEMEEENENET